MNIAKFTVNDPIAIILRNYLVFVRPTAKMSVLKVRNDALPTQENMDRFPNCIKGKIIGPEQLGAVQNARFL